MEVQVSLIFFVISFITTNLIFCCHGITASPSNDDDRKVYIVYMGDRLGDNVGLTDAASHHTSILEQVVGSGASDSLIHSYHRSFNGFTAHLNNKEMRQLAKMEGVVSVFPNGKKQLYTTRSWDFLGFHQNVKRATLESNIIIGMIDTGISPESKSFSDKGFGPPPMKWKGSCFKSSDFKCNNKIIGAKHYRSNKTFVPGDIQSPLDSHGHGTHTSSTAAGALVSKASLEGIGIGTARGGVPRARIAVYKACWLDGCHGDDILAAFDDAIADGVDILSVSLGENTALDYFNDVIAIGTFHAMKKGVFTSAAAGNGGPALQTVCNVAPWLLSVAASTIDREFTTRIKLGNAKTYEGFSINTIALDRKMYPLIYGGDVPNTKKKFNSSVSRTCNPDSLDISKVKGNIVLCDALTDGQELVKVGAVGGIMYDDGAKDGEYSFPIPISYLTPTEGSSVSKYYNSTRKPTATIFKTIKKKNKLAPSVASFSSRGPNLITHDILTPDVTAPGVNILAAWSKRTTVTGIEGDKRIVPYNIISGTSMACPHASGAAAYIKTFHPLWSPAAIKSALITTATPMTSKSAEAEFAYGAGQINPLKAVDPGLIYDLREVDYVDFLCGQGYSSKNLRLVTGITSSCNQATKDISVWNLNYPSFTISTGSKQSVTRIFPRRVTNVGSAFSKYKSIVEAPKGMKIQVKPSVLHFKSHHQVKSFVVTVKVKTSNSTISGSLIWDDGVHKVRSPIVAYVLASK